MLRIKPTRRIRISNRLALAAALALSLTLFTGVNGPHDGAPGQQQDAVAVSAQGSASESTDDTSRSGKRFSISRLLFGHG